MPTGGAWTPLKRAAGNFAISGGSGTVSPEGLLRQYVAATGGARALSRSEGGGGRHGGGGSSAARKVGRNLAGFLSSVRSAGLDEALREIGLANLIGRSVGEVAAGLLNALAGPANTLDEHAARLALIKTNDELFLDSGTYEDIESKLSEVLDQAGLTGILAKFFGHYLYELFCRDFYEVWVKKVGSDAAGRSLGSVKDCIDSSVRAKFAGRDATHMNWRGKEGEVLAEQIMRETLEIFEVMG